MNSIKRCYPITIRSQEGERGNNHVVPIVFDTPTNISGRFKEEFVPKMAVNSINTRIGNYGNNY